MESTPSEWVLIGQTYAPPIPYPIMVVDSGKKQGGVFDGGHYYCNGTIDPLNLAKISLGVTTYIWQDQTTGDVRCVEVLGRDVPPQSPQDETREPHIFDKIISAAMSSGPQRFTVGETEFLLGVVPREEKLPIK